MRPGTDEFAKSLVTLAERFAGLAARLTQAARELQASGALPPESLLEELAGARSGFSDLRARVLDAARSMSVVAPPRAEIDSLEKLEPVMHAVVEALATEDRRLATAEAPPRAPPGPPPPPGGPAAPP